LLALSILAKTEDNVAASRPRDSGLATALLKLLGDDDVQIRRKACEAVGANWNPIYVPRLTDLLRDGDEEVRSAAFSCLRVHILDLEAQLPAYRKMVEEDGLAAPMAMRLLGSRQDVAFTREQLVRLLSSTNLPVPSLAAERLLRENPDPNELAPLLTNSLPHLRLVGLNTLLRMGDKAAIDRIVSMLRDPNEAIRWMVRSNLRRLTGQKLGADPAAWEKWWTENKETFTPLPPGRAAGLHQAREIHATRLGSECVFANQP
jgi:HEAT repeat protein